MEGEKLTKKERRALSKERKRQEQEARRKRLKFKKLAIWITGGVVIVFLGAKLVNWIKTPQPEIAGEAVEIAEGEWIKGNAEAQVTLVEYSDLQCPACASYYPLVRQLSEEFSDDLRVAYRHFPLTSIHPNAVAAARASEAAGRQGKFWEMHDMLFEKQAEWSSEKNPKDKFIAYAKELGLDEESFVADFEGKEVADAVDKDLFSANSLGLSSTPSFFVNGKKVVNPGGYEAFKELIETEIRSYPLE